MGFGLASAFVEFGTRGESKVYSTINTVASKVASLRSTGTGTLGVQFDGMADHITGMLNPIKLVSSALASLGAGMGVGSMIGMAASAERTRAEFNVLTGSAEKTAEVLGGLKAAFAGTSVSGDQYRAVAQDMLAQGTAAEDVVSTTIKLGKVAVATGASLEQMASAYDRAEMTGKVSIRTLMAMQPVATQLGKIYNLDEEALAKMANDGVLKIEHLRYALDSLAGDGGKFAGILDAQKGTLLGQFDILKANVANVFRDIGASAIQAFNLSDVTARLTAWVADFKTNYGETIKSTFTTIGQTADLVFTFIGENQAIVGLLLDVAGAFVGVKVAGVACNTVITIAKSLWGPMAFLIGNVTTAVMGLGRGLMTLAANPVGLAIVGVLGLVLALWKLGQMFGVVSEGPLEFFGKRMAEIAAGIGENYGIHSKATRAKFAKMGGSPATKGLATWQEAQEKAQAATGKPPALTPKAEKAESGQGAQFVGIAALAEKMQLEASKADMARQQLTASQDSASALSRLAGAVQNDSLKVTMANSGVVATNNKWW